MLTLIPPAGTNDIVLAQLDIIAAAGGGAAHAVTGGAVDPFVFRLSIFVLAVCVGYYVGWAVAPRRHPPPMWGTHPAPPGLWWGRPCGAGARSWGADGEEARGGSGGGFGGLGGGGLRHGARRRHRGGDRAAGADDLDAGIGGRVPFAGRHGGGAGGGRRPLCAERVRHRRGRVDP